MNHKKNNYKMKISKTTIKTFKKLINKVKNNIMKNYQI